MVSIFILSTMHTCSITYVLILFMLLLVVLLGNIGKNNRHARSEMMCALTRNKRLFFFGLTAVYLFLGGGSAMCLDSQAS